MTDDRFGNIQIDPDFPEASQGPEVPLAGQGTSEEPSPVSHFDVPEVQSTGNRYIHRQRQRKKFDIPLPSRRTITWVSCIPLLVVLYGVGSYFLVPSIISGILLPNLSRHFDRQVEAGRVIFSPFTLTLLVDRMSIGPVLGDKTGKELLSMESARFHFSLQRILSGKPVFMKANLDGVSVNVVRREQDMTADLAMLSDLFLSPPTEQDVLDWPRWLFLDEVKVSSGKIFIDDRQAKKVFTVEDIQFYLPSAVTRERDKTALPRLQAVIDSSPFEVSAVRFRNQSGAWRTGFSFEFKKLIMSNFKELLPMPATGLQLSDGEVDIKLDIILPEEKHGPGSIIVEGEADLKSAKLHDPDAQTTLVIPEARIVYHIVPSDKLVRLSDVEFHEPVLTLAGKKKEAANDPLATVAYLKTVLDKMSSASEILEVENFLWNNGKVVMSGGGQSDRKSELNDVTLTMTGFTSAGHRREHPDAATSASYTFRAKDISTKEVTGFVSEGHFDLAGTLSGRLEISGLDLARYLSLLPESYLALSKGKADLSFHYEYADNLSQGRATSAGRNKIYNGEMKTTGYVLARDGKKAASGELVNCQGFSLDTLSRSIVCDQLEMVNSDIFNDTIFGPKDKEEPVGADKWQFMVNNLLVRGSTIHSQLKGFASAESAPLLVRDVNIEGKSLQIEKNTDNVRASARIGKKGKVTVSGHYSSRANQGALQIDIQQMELSLLRPYFSSWFVPKLNTGIFSASGSLQLPGKEFKGQVQVNDLDAGEGNGARMRWRSGVAKNCTYRPDPLFFAVKEMVVQKPSLDPGLSSGGQPVDKYLRINDETLPQSVHVEKIHIEDGNFSLSEPIIYPGFQPSLHNINGTLSINNGSNLDFSFTGNIEKQSSFALLGTSSLRTMRSYTLTVDEFPFLPFDSVLKKEGVFSSVPPSASFRQDMIRKENSSEVSTDILVRNMIPDTAGSSTPILSLLVNEDHQFSMKLEGIDSADKTQPFLLEKFINRLHHLGVKAAISPNLVLKSTLPDLDLPSQVSFTPGSSNPEKPLSLSDYQNLLQMRPFTALSLQGQYDPRADKDILQAELQKEADRLRDIENKRRALEKIRILQQEKRRLKEKKEGSTEVVTEEIVPGDTPEDLRPLSRETVKVEPSRLEDLARQRARFLQDYLLNKLQLDTRRITIDPNVTTGSASVGIHVLPYLPSEGVKEPGDF